MYDLEERTLMFAVRAREFIMKIKKTFINVEDLKQLLRSSGSVGANYIEANEALGKKDFIMRIKISLKESKECMYWLKILLSLEDMEEESYDQCKELFKEAGELRKILASILSKT